MHFASETNPQTIRKPHITHLNHNEIDVATKSMHELHPSGNHRSEQKAPRNYSQRKAQPYEPRLSSDRQCENPSDLWPDRDRSKQPQPDQPPSIPRPPDPLRRIAFDRNTEAFDEPIPSRPTCKNDKPRPGSVPGPRRKRSHRHAHPCGYPDRNSSDKIKKTEPKRHRYACDECSHLYESIFWKIKRKPTKNSLSGIRRAPWHHPSLKPRLPHRGS